MSDKYLPLFNYLASYDSHKNELILSFTQIENMLNDKLLASALVHRAWWGNELSGSHIHAHAWLDAGWKVDTVNQNAKWVKFKRFSSVNKLPQKTHPPLTTIPSHKSSTQPTGFSKNLEKFPNHSIFEKQHAPLHIDGEYKAMRKIVLISCVKTKLDRPAKAQDLYISDLFKSNLAYAKSLKPHAIFILSAKYGLVSLDQNIAPYEKTLNNMKTFERKIWANLVLNQLAQHANLQSDLFIILAGLTYRQYLIPALQHYQIPFEGLSFGQQLHELKRRTS